MEPRKTDVFSLHIPSSPNTCRVKIEGLELRGLVDSGSELTLLSERIYHQLKYKPRLARRNVALKSANDSALRVLGAVELPIKIHGIALRQEFLVVADLNRNLILGRDFLVQNKARLYFDFNKMKLNNAYVPLDLDVHVSALARVQKTQVLQPNSVCVLDARIKSSKYFTDGDHIFEPVEQGFLQEQPELRALPGLVSIRKNKLPIQIVNGSNKTVKVKKGCVIGKIGQVKMVNEVNASRTTEVSDEEFKAQVRVDEINRPMVEELLTRNRDVFAFSDLELKQTDLVVADVETGDHEPINVRPYRIAYNDRKAVEQTIDDLLEAGLIERSRSKWSFPLVMVDKKPEAPHLPCKRRMCVDFRKLNEIVHIRTYPLPLIDDILYELEGTTYFTTIDLRSGFHQIPLTREASEKCTFNSHKGLFKFKCLPFGLKNAPMEFQRMVTALLEGLESFSKAFIDDILIYSKGSLQDHLDKVQQVFDRLRKHSLKLKLNKCQWAAKEITYLGFKVTTKGVAPDEAKVAAIKRLKPCENQRECRSLLGMVSFYRRFIPRFAEITEPLVALTKKYARFKWTEECQTAFEQIKKQLTVVPLLAHANPNKPYLLYTDASDMGIGACLCQKSEEGESWLPGIPDEKPIYFISHKLTPSQRRSLCVGGKELFAIMYALQRLHCFVYNADVTILTDHQPLRYLFSAELSNRKYQAWALKIAAYNCKIQYIKGTNNVCADLLSRSLPKEGEEAGEDVQMMDDNAIECAVINSNRVDPGRHREVDPGRLAPPQDEELPRLEDFDLEGEQERDPEIRDIKERLRKKTGDTAQYRTFMVKDNLLYYISQVEDEPTLRLYVPKHLREKVIKAYHDENGHMAVNKTFLTIKSKYYWPNLWKELDQAIEKCVTCKRRNLQQRRAPVQEIGLPPYPMASLQVDLAGPHTKTLSGNVYICTFVDLYSGWPEVFCLPDKSAESVVEVLLEEIIPRHSCPISISSDNGKEFANKYFKETLERLKIKHIKSSPYSPRTQGMVERSHRTLNDVISKLLGEYPDTWDLHINAAVAAMRFNVSRTTLQSPFSLLYHRQAVLPIDVLLTPRRKSYSDSFHDLAWENLHKQFMEVLKTTQKFKEKRNKTRNRGRKACLFKVGDPVFLKNNQKKTKLGDNWLTGYNITKKTGDVSFHVRNQLTGEVKRAHADNLRLAKVQWEIPNQDRNLRKAQMVAVPPDQEEESNSSGESEDFLSMDEDEPEEGEGPRGSQDSPIHEDQAMSEEEEEIDSGTQLQPRSRTGRTLRPPRYLNDYQWQQVQRARRVREDSEEEEDIPTFELRRAVRTPQDSSVSLVMTKEGNSAIRQESPMSVSTQTSSDSETEMEEWYPMEEVQGTKLSMYTSAGGGCPRH